MTNDYHKLHLNGTSFADNGGISPLSIYSSMDKLLSEEYVCFYFLLLLLLLFLVTLTLEHSLGIISYIPDNIDTGINVFRISNLTIFLSGVSI